MGSDRPDEQEPRPGGRARWVARVGRRLSPSANEPAQRDTQHLAELAAKASDAASRSARLAAGAAGAAALARLTVDRFGVAPIEEARATAREIAAAAELAADSSVEARDRAEIVDQAVRFESAPSPAQPGGPLARGAPEQDPDRQPRPQNPEKT